MATLVRSKTVGTDTELWFINGFQYQSANLLNYPIREAGDAERSRFTILFRNVDPLGRGWLVTFVFDGYNNTVDKFLAKIASCFTIDTRCCTPVIAVDVAKGFYIHMRVVKNSVKSFMCIIFL